MFLLSISILEDDSCHTSGNKQDTNQKPSNTSATGYPVPGVGRLVIPLHAQKCGISYTIEMSVINAVKWGKVQYGGL